MAEFKQNSFEGGINLLLDDTRLPVSVKNKEGDSMYDVSYNQYRVGFNLRNRFDVLTPIPSSITDNAAPYGLKQGLLTFGNFLILFVAGKAYYRLNTSTGWTKITQFSMSQIAPRYYFAVVPLATTNYGRIANVDANGVVAANVPISQVNQIAGTFGNVPGLLVQDGINQPQFIYIDQNNVVQCRVTQKYDQWNYDPKGVNDKREYVPIGTFMAWFNGILFIVDTNFNFLYRSVSGRPLDFVINVDINGDKGGDATTTNYSVGVGGITAIEVISNTLFVAAGGSSAFSVTLNTTPNAPTIFGEYTFIRTQLFNSNCINEKGIVDILGDTVFIDSNGLRSFNAIQQQQNEGRNAIFSANIQSLFTGIFQKPLLAAAINFDNYAIFSVNTYYGYALIVYDTLAKCYASIDQAQLGNHAVKQFAKIEIDSLSLYAITDDDRVVQLYASTSIDTATVRLGALCTQDPKKEISANNLRLVMSNITQDYSVTCHLFVNNRWDSSISNSFRYAPVVAPYVGTPSFPDVGTQVNNIMFSFPNSGSGWKIFFVITWTGGGSITNIAVDTSDTTPLQPLLTQAVIKNTK